MHNVDKKLQTLLNTISAARLEDERVSLAHLLSCAKNSNYNYEESASIAAKYIIDFRKNTGNVGLEEFFRQYGLETKEGMAVMSLAEALLRIPDADTANKFIHDKLASAQWQISSKGSSALVKASSLGLKIAAKLLEYGKAVSQVADPVVRESMKQSMQLIGEHFVMGETIHSAMKKAQQYEKQGYMLSYDMLGEAARSEEKAQLYLQNYLNGIEAVSADLEHTHDLYKKPGISVKLSALHPKYKLTNKQQVLDELFARLKIIASKAKQGGIAITIDAEESARLDISLELMSKLIADEEFKGYGGIGLAVQAYNKSAPYVIDFIVKLAQIHATRIPVRLVKGAYWDSEIKLAQVQGVASYPVYTRKEYSDLSYLVCAVKMLENEECIYSQFATHNALTIATIKTMASEREYEFQRLYGMGAGIYNHIVADAPCRIYAPVGAHKELLPYLIRRILENGASASFLKKVIDSEVEVEELIKDPVVLSAERAEKDITAITLPEKLYGVSRKNSIGPDLGNRIHLEQLEKDISAFHNNKWVAASIINGRKCNAGEEYLVKAPYDENKIIGKVTFANEQEIYSAIASCKEGFASWSNTSVEERIRKIHNFAELLEAHSAEIIAMCHMEAGKTLGDAIAEIREAIDFCYYYSSVAKDIFSAPHILPGPTGELNELSYHGRGVFVCISPWNFPLAIFTGQVVAALLAGNSVIAKPAEQTSLIAGFTVELLLKAGIPQNVISLVIGEGGQVGSHLLNDKNISGVVFTGSCETAEVINNNLAQRGAPILPFIAETGGINTMIVDSTALIEQAVDDIIISAFGSSGQRCSALRVLYVQEEISDDLIEELKGAMACLAIGNPENYATDIGPVIDEAAYDGLVSYILEAEKKFKLIGRTPMRRDLKGYFVAPVAFEISNISELEREVFGPILHVIRYKAQELDNVLRDINNSGYGLTMGVHSRIVKQIEYIRNKVNIGNIYVNRSMIGAVVGVQPFGGEGLSGTGPKAGGPNYLKRFATERTYTENTVAIGGNRDLLTGC